jgi:hypothetical protein
VRDFEYIDSLTCYGGSVNGVFERMVQSRREVWFGSDGAGLLRNHFVRSVFFDEDQRARWEASPRGARPTSKEPSDDLFAPGCWNGPRAQLAAIARHGSVKAALERRGPVTLHTIKQLIGEALVPEPERRSVFDLCVSLDDAVLSNEAHDQLGRSGVGVARDEGDRREELIFDAETLELLGTRQVLINARSGYAPAGAIVGWSCFVDRQLVSALPDGVPPIPGPPCAPPGAGRGTPVRPGFTLSTGYFTDLRAHADRWLRDGIITEDDHAALYARQDETDRIIRSRRQPPPDTGPR